MIAPERPSKRSMGSALLGDDDDVEEPDVPIDDAGLPSVQDPRERSSAMTLASETCDICANPVSADQAVYWLAPPPGISLEVIKEEVRQLPRDTRVSTAMALGVALCRAHPQCHGEDGDGD